MNVPESLRDVDRLDAVVRTIEYDDDETVIAVDFGTSDDVTINVVDSTTIVVVDGQHLEFELPEEARDVSVRNGVLTIEE